MADSQPPPLPGASPAINPPARVHAPRLPGTYAANYGREPSWQWGAAVLGACLALAVAGEILLGACTLLGTSTFYPRGHDLLRVGLTSVLALGVWAGWGPARWLLAVSGFLNGAYLLMWTVALNAASQAGLAPGQPAPPHTILLLPELFQGFLLLGSAGYVALSADVSAFVRHRRAHGARWTLAPLLLVAGGFAALVFFSPAVYLLWLGTQRPGAQRFAEESLRAMSQRWDPAVYAARADEDFLATWPASDRKLTFGSLAPLGALQRTDGPGTDAVATGLDAGGGGFLVKVRCNVRRAEFAHGHVAFSCMVQRSLFGSWRLADLVVSEIEMDGAGG